MKNILKETYKKEGGGDGPRGGGGRGVRKQCTNGIFVLKIGMDTHWKVYFS